MISTKAQSPAGRPAYNQFKGSSIQFFYDFLSWYVKKIRQVTSLA